MANRLFPKLAIQLTTMCNESQFDIKVKIMISPTEIPAIQTRLSLSIDVLFPSMSSFITYYIKGGLWVSTIQIAKKVPNA